MPRLPLFATLLLLAGCDGSATDDAGPPRLDAAPAADDAGARDGGGSTMDGGGTDAGGFDASRPPSDAGPGGVPTPPPGTVRCGGGTVGPDALLTACQMFDPVTDIHVGGETECGGLLAQSARYEVWCSPSTLYVWIEMVQVDDPAMLMCTRTFPHPDGGVISFSHRQFGWVEYDTAQNAISYEVTGGARHIDGPQRVEWSGPGIDGGAELPWTGTYEYTGNTGGDFTGGGRGIAVMSLLRADCDSIPVPDGLRYVFVVPLTWTTP